jgi:hypothetical protein
MKGGRTLGKCMSQWGMEGSKASDQIFAKSQREDPIEMDTTFTTLKNREISD